MLVNVDLKTHDEILNVENSYRDYLILDTRKLQYKKCKDKFKNAIEVLDLINTLHWANDFYKKAKSDIIVPTDIFYKCMDASFTDKPFSDSELIEYYNTAVLMEDFFMTIINFKQIDTYISYDLELTLFGLSYDAHKKLSEKEKENVHENYGNLYCDLRIRKIDVTSFIEKVKALISKLKK